MLAHSSLIPPLISFIAVLGTIIGSGRCMPSTCPNGLRLVEHLESCPSPVFLSKSMSHSRGVNSARAEWVVGSTLAYSLWHKAVGVPWGWPLGRVCYGGVSLLYHLNLLSYMKAHHLQPGMLFHILLCPIDIPFSLKRISFCPNHTSWHQLDCACKFIIISPLCVPFVVGLVQGFGMSFLEAFLHLFNIGRDLPEGHICTYHREKKVNQNSRLFPKYEEME